MTTEIPLVMTVKQVSELLGCNVKTTYELISSGALEAVHLGRSLRVTRHSLLQFLRVPDAEEAQPALRLVDGGGDV